jgi:O-antigen/teichoic acid export membrane protein
MSSTIESLGLRKLGNNSAVTILRQGIAIVLGLSISILLARLLGPEGNGQYAMGILLPTMLATFLNLGVAPSNVYHIASNKIDPKTAFKSTFWLWSLLSLIGIFGGAFVIILKSNSWFPGIPPYLLWIGILSFPIVLFQTLLSSFFQGLQEFKQFNKVLLISPLLTLFLAVFLVGFLSQGVLGAIVSFVLGHIGGLLVSIVLLKPHLCKKNECNDSTNYTKDCLRYGYKAHLSNILTFVNYRADLFLVNFFLNPAATGIYVVAVQIAERLWMLSGSISIVLLPRLSELSENENKRKQLTPLIARWVMLISLIGAIMMALFASPIIHILYGEEYVNAVSAILWLLPGIFIGSMTKILANDIASRGKPEFNLYSSLVVVSLNITANITLIPKWGIKGAAISTSIAYLFSAFLVLGIYSHLSKNPWWKIFILSRDDKWLASKSISTIKQIIYK